MNSFVTAKEVLLSHDIFSDARKNVQANGKRSTAYEFQDYAYRLAEDLNDLEHLNMYMRLVKHTERHVIERVFQYVADSGVENKGALFMWKLKQFRKELKKKAVKNDLSYETVMNGMTKRRNEMAAALIRKHNDVGSNHMIQMAAIQKPLKKNSKALVIGATAPLLFSILNDKGFKVFGIDPSREIVKSVKDGTFTCIGKDFMKNTYKENQFDLVIIHKLWTVVPSIAESGFLAQCRRILSPEGTIVLEYKQSEEICSEGWKEFQANGEDVLYFEKRNSVEAIDKLLSHAKFQVAFDIQFLNYHYVSNTHITS